MQERVIHFRPRTVFSVLAIVLAVAAVLEVIWIARHVIVWILIALFLTLAINPLVEFLQRATASRAAAGPSRSPTSPCCSGSSRSARSSSRRSSTS